MTHIINTIPGHETAELVKELKNFGHYRGTQKYLVRLNNQLELIQLFPKNLFKPKKEEALILQNCSDLGVPVAVPTHIGQTPDGLCFVISPFIEGTDAYQSRHTLSESELYTLGQEAGAILKKMHHIPAPNELDHWYERSLAKHKRYLSLYNELTFEYPHVDSLNSFIEQHKHYLKDRPSTFQHDDFHLRNLIVRDKHLNGIIDFENRDYGDPYFDFVKLGLFTRNNSIDFAVGQLDGYFDAVIPEEFWVSYTIYLGMTIVSSIVWTTTHYPESIDDMIHTLDTVVKDHNYFNQTVPDWYTHYNRPQQKASPE